jgi:UDP-N-acetylmuramoylalanine--D-glutamate ligase
MDKLDYFNKKIGIVGLGISGISSYKYLLTRAQEIICFDDNHDNLKKFIDIYGDSNVKPICNNSWNDLDLIVLSPGIPTKYPTPHKIMDIIKNNDIEHISDIDILYSDNIGKKFIGVTGTNGKSTICNFIYHITKACGLNYALCGNIGIPVLDLSDNYDGYIIELSSFQLEIIQYLKLDIAIISNITPDHLDRYKDFDDYIQTKMKIFEICTSQKIMKNDENIINNHEIYAIKKSEDLYSVIDPYNHLINVETNFLQNKMLKENYVYAYIVATLLKLDNKDIVEAARSFKTLKHRMEFVGTYKNINFYNDSKATNVDSGVASLSSLSNIFWLAGGISKGSSYEPIKKYFSHIKKAYLFGQSRNEIAEFLNKRLDFIICNNLEEAFNLALKDAFLEKSANILLAPLCSSFDQFKNFEDRGNKFIEMFHKIQK